MAMATTLTTRTTTTTTIMMMMIMMMMMMTMTMLVGVVDSQMRADVCVPVTKPIPSSVKRPEVSSQFTVDVECNLMEQKRTVYVREYYDLDINRGRLTKTIPSGVNEFYLDYDHDLVLQVDPKSGQCDSGLLFLQPDPMFFGFQMKGQNTHMFSPSAALHFGGNTSETFVNYTTIRGINVDHWSSCQYLDSLKATARVDWYFSRTGRWNMQQGGGSAPVRMTVVGKMVLDNQTVVPFNHVYDFFNFKPTVSLTDFQVPDGVFCPERSLVDIPKPFPNVPTNFDFVGETADKFSNRYNLLEEYYDSKAKLALYRFKMDVFKMTSLNHQVLNDYNSGVSYLIDDTQGSCQLSPITQATVVYSVSINNNEVRMETPREFFMDSTVSYQYTGTVTARNIPAERWVGVTSNAKGFVGTNVTIEWYFATSGLSSWNNNGEQYRTPLQFRMYLPNRNVTEPSIDFNIFYYNVLTASFSQVDTSTCFKDSQRLPLRFIIPKSQETIIRRNVEQSKIAIHSAISLHTGISPIRVADVQLYFNPYDVEVTLDLLDMPPSFEDVSSCIPQNSLCTAAKLLQDSFNDGTFSFDFDDGTTVEKITPDKSTLAAISATCGSIASTTTRNPNHGGSTRGPNHGGSTRGPNHGGSTSGPNHGGSTSGPNHGFTTIRGPGINGTFQIQTSSSLYSSGSLAGLAVGMLVMGGAGGAVGGFLFFK